MEKIDDRIVRETPIDGDASTSSGYQDTIEWTPHEENRLVMKLDLIVMPLLMVVFLALQLDRANIGQTLNDNFLKDVGITQFDFNIGQQLLSVGIFLFEVSEIAEHRMI